MGVRIDWVGRSRFRLFRLIEIIRRLRKEPVDVIQSAHFYTNLYVGLSGRLLNIPSIGAVRNDLISEISANGLWGRWLLSTPHRLIANSELAKVRAVQLGLRDGVVEYVPNVIDVELERAIRNGARRTTNVIFVGRLVEQKRPELFMDLAKTLSDRYPELDLTFQIVGDGPLRSKLERLSAGSTFPSERLIFHGELDDLSKTYAEADILVLTSKFEGVPNVLLEAMSFGIAVVAMRVGAVSEIVNGQNGLLVDPDDFDGLVEAVYALAVDAKRRIAIGDRGKEHVGEHHTVNGLGEKLMGIYNKLNVQ
jgi:glycosyltransferase involved in cell wall biosynthesis